MNVRRRKPSIGRNNGIEIPNKSNAIDPRNRISRENTNTRNFPITQSFNLSMDPVSMISGRWFFRTFFFGSHDITIF
jgi:hypothetical protein